MNIFWIHSKEVIIRGMGIVPKEAVITIEDEKKAADLITMGFKETKKKATHKWNEEKHEWIETEK